MDYSPLIAFLRQKQYLTDLEKDILDTENELQKNPFNRCAAEAQVKKNNIKYPNIFATIAALPGTVIHPFCEAEDADIQSNLNRQLDALIAKELEEQNLVK